MLKMREAMRRRHSDEGDLVQNAKRGNPEAFGQLVVMYQNRLFTSIIHIVRSHDDAEDIVQDAFVQAFVKLGTFREGSTFYTWLYRIAVNLAISRNRRRRRRLSIEETRDISGNEPYDPAGLPSERLMRAEDAVVIQRALDALTDEHRTILVMRGIEGFDYETIAKVLDLNPGTVRSRLHRARAQLKQQLDGSLHCNA
jgi:RNA polymerase sigma-70 factor (ECF subfamily)